MIRYDLILSVNTIYSVNASISNNINLCSLVRNVVTNICNKNLKKKEIRILKL